MSDIIPSYIRTYVPLAVSYGLVWFATEWGFVLDEASSLAAQTFATGVVFAVYYGIVRALERRWPWVGSFVGLPKAPTYDAVVKQLAPGSFVAGPAAVVPTGNRVPGNVTANELAPPKAA